MALPPGRDILRALIARSSGMINSSTPHGSLRSVKEVHVAAQMSPQKANKRRTSSLNVDSIWPVMLNYKTLERKAKRRATNPLAQLQRVMALMTPHSTRICLTSIGRIPRGAAREAFNATDDKARTDKIPPKMTTGEAMAILGAVTTISQSYRPADKSQ